MVIWLERGADLHMAQLMPLPLTVSCFSKIQTGFTFLVPAHLGSPGQRAVKRVCVCACVCVSDDRYLVGRLGGVLQPLLATLFRSLALFLSQPRLERRLRFFAPPLSLQLARLSPLRFIVHRPFTGRLAARRQPVTHTTRYGRPVDRGGAMGAYAPPANK